MSEPSNEPLRDSGPRISLVATAFGAVAGIVTSFVFEPLTRRIPVPLVADFIRDLVKPLLVFAMAAAFAVVAARIRRLDTFLNRHIGYAAPLASAVLAFTTWMRAGAPTDLFAVIAVVLIAVETFLFLVFCAYMVAQGMKQIAEQQKAEYEARREGEAQKIAMQAIAAGDPQAAVAEFSFKAAESFNNAVMSGCFMFLVAAFHFCSILVATAAAAYSLFHVPLLWSAATGIVLALAAMKVVSGSLDLGERYAHQKPVDEKYQPIRPDPEK